MSGGGKGGSSTSSVQIPEYIEAAAQRNLNKAERISQIPYAPQYGPDVAAFTPMQQAGFQGTAQVASAFGVPGGGMSQRDIMGGMDAPMRYAGGVQGYSSAPIFQQSIDELARQRPAQKSYIDSFFIDPVSGQYAYQPFDYTTINTMAEDQRQQAAANRGNERAIAQMQATGTALSAPQYNTYVNTIQDATGNSSYNPATDVLTSAERAAIAANPQAQLAQDALYMNVLADAGGEGNYSFKNPSPTGSYGGSLVTGQPSAANQSYFDSVNRGSNFDGGGNAREDSFGSDLGRSLTDPSYDPPGNVVSRSLGIGAGAEDSGASGGDGCVVATHAVESGAFTPQMKREAVVWCMNVLHDKWWGEAVRRGYRHLGRKKIEQGKAREHYAEFRRYIEFANGKKRDARGAVTFALRTAQFFAVGLVKKDA